jgi:GDP-L-fucose synthase
MAGWEISPLIEDFSTERIIVTGAGGVLGTALGKLLSKHRCHDLLLLRRMDCDLLDKTAVETVWQEFHPSMVFHLAGRVAGIQGNLNFAGAAFYENAAINLNVIEASRRSGVHKIIAAGTTAIYPDKLEMPMREIDLWNGPPHGSEASYGHAKRAMLANLQAYQQQYGMDFVYLICTNLYGPNDRFDIHYGHVVPSLVARFFEAAREKLDCINIWGDGSPTRDFLFAGDAAEGFVLAALRGSGAYNLASGRTATIRDLAENLQKISGFSGDLRWDTSRPKGQQKRAYDVSAMHDLGWKACTELVDGLTRTYRWYSDNLGRVRH